MVKKHVATIHSTSQDHPHSSWIECLAQSLERIQDHGSSSNPFSTSSTSKKNKKKRHIASIVKKGSTGGTSYEKIFKTDTTAVNEEFPTTADNVQRIIQADESDYD
jgi:hypothetical protein